jgi:hypothetical protein
MHLRYRHSGEVLRFFYLRPRASCSLAQRLGCASRFMPGLDRALHALRTWLDSWSGIGRIAVGMARQGYDLQLTRYDERGWRATFYTTGMEHSPTSATGTGWERTTRTRSSSSPNPVSYRYTWRFRVRRESSSAA